MFHSIIHRSTRIDIGDCYVRLITEKDVAAITAYYQRNRDYLQPWEPLRDEGFFTEYGWDQRLDQILKLHKHKLAYYFVIQPKHSDEICGVVNYSNLVRHPFHACHVGYSIDERYQGLGIMGRALAAANQWMFEDQSFHRIIAAYMPRNEKSAAVLRKCGFEIEGTAKDYLLINGRWEDHILTACLNASWTPPIN
ncbi:ribosomal protein S5-alanine N-acetyltransferase [Photobacterium aphoticum]|uniref:Ribosomal-protein-alanine acetyltransferase n=1 Tax=Photobacterium aphoticum TaxID=754436 RepID=A0A0J1GUN3_9GAMM|nr:ribosomal protein S5-alanine N-acetyltransferase [Photobacterium aphoticum]KLV03139.1 ribosomal-protein-alanine acetyltransferase [Photobacterium aphoticum]PSU45186.1 30S ribosomal protein S5 alanine N-acetyltransferase [Photobacterium aphoticum]